MKKLSLWLFCGLLFLSGCQQSDVLTTESSATAASDVAVATHSDGGNDDGLEVTSVPTDFKGRLSTVGLYFDTVVTIVTYDVEESVLDQALEECAKYEALLSKTVEGSDVWKINHAEGQPVTVSDDTRVILETALELGDASGGRLDVTIAPVVSLWDFTGENPTLPDKEEVAAAMKNVDYRQIKLDDNVVTIPAGYSIDLGAIAKGYIADQVAVFLKQKGVHHGLLNFGGNVVVIGDKPDGSPWSVGIQDPDEETGTYLTAIQVIDRSVVTSGIYERGFDLNGVRYHHILDTDNGWPLQNDLASVTIVSESSMLGDALSTSCLALGYEDALALLQHYPEAEALFISRDGVINATEGAAEMLLDVA